MEKLTIDEFAKLAGVLAITVRSWIKKGIINATQETYKGLRTRYMIDKDEIKKIKK